MLPGPAGPCKFIPCKFIRANSFGARRHLQGMLAPSPPASAPGAAGLQFIQARPLRLRFWLRRRRFRSLIGCQGVRDDILDWHAIDLIPDAILPGRFRLFPPFIRHRDHHSESGRMGKQPALLPSHSPLPGEHRCCIKRKAPPDAEPVIAYSRSLPENLFPGQHGYL